MRIYVRHASAAHSAPCSVARPSHARRPTTSTGCRLHAAPRQSPRPTIVALRLPLVRCPCAHGESRGMRGRRRTALCMCTCAGEHRAEDFVRCALSACRPRRAAPTAARAYLVSPSLCARLRAGGGLTCMLTAGGSHLESGPHCRSLPPCMALTPGRWAVRRCTEMVLSESREARARHRTRAIHPWASRGQARAPSRRMLLLGLLLLGGRPRRPRRPRPETSSRRLGGFALSRAWRAR